MKDESNSTPPNDDFARKKMMMRCSGILIRSAATALVLMAGWLSSGQTQSTPTPTPTPAPVTSVNKNPDKIETEVITITDDAAFPNTITRKPGRFFLLLINKTYRSPPKVVFDSPTAAAAQTQVIGQGLNLPFLTNTRRLASILDAPPGVYHIKRQADGRVLLTINIEP